MVKKGGEQEETFSYVKMKSKDYGTQELRENLMAACKELIETQKRKWKEQGFTLHDEALAWAFRKAAQSWALKPLPGEEEKMVKRGDMPKKCYFCGTKKNISIVKWVWVCPKCCKERFKSLKPLKDL